MKYVLNHTQGGHITSKSIVNGASVTVLTQKLGTLGKIALLGSYRIWLARKSQDWSPGDLISRVSNDPAIYERKTFYLIFFTSPTRQQY